MSSTTAPGWPLWVCEHCRYDGVVPDIPADVHAVLRRAGKVALCWDHLAVLITLTEPVTIVPIEPEMTILGTVAK